jgi:hypothetical protein
MVGVGVDYKQGREGEERLRLNTGKQVLWLSYSIHRNIEGEKSRTEEKWEKTMQNYLRCTK